MIVLGIDPSSTSTGYGLVEYRNRQSRYLDCGCIRPKADLSFEDRLVFLYDHLGGILAASSPDEVAVESTFFGKDAGAVAKLGQARGVILLAVRQAGKPIAHYAPAEVKKAVVGRGQATKKQVWFMITRLLGLRDLPHPLDASDALAIALCHINHLEFRPPPGEHCPRPEIQALLRRMSRR